MKQKRKRTRNENLMMNRAKSHIGTGMVSMAGMSAIGGIAGTPGFPAAGLPMVGTIGGGLSLVNVGETAKTGMALAKMLKSDNYSDDCKNKIVRNIMRKK